MAVAFENTPIDGLFIIHPHMYFDDRGLYKKIYEKNAYQNVGIEAEFNETSDLYSQKGALRGLHYQTNYSQAKLVHVITGSIFDVALDLRPGSRTFGKYYAALLNAEDHRALYIPEGFAHGFITLTDEAIFSYQCSGRYDPASCGGILWNDPDLAIPWPLEQYGVNEVICTDKDRNWPTFKEYCSAMR